MTLAAYLFHFIIISSTITDDVAGMLLLVLQEPLNCSAVTYSMHKSKFPALCNARNVSLTDSSYVTGHFLRCLRQIRTCSVSLARRVLDLAFLALRV